MPPRWRWGFAGDMPGYKHDAPPELPARRPICLSPNLHHILRVDLEPPDTHYFSAAVGWLELGNAREARVELAQLSASCLQNPEVLEVRWLLAAAEQDWDGALDTSRALMRVAPQRASGWLHHAYALRRVRGGGLRAAWDALLPAFDQFPKEPTVAYNLSCYASQLAWLDEARKWFHRALELGNKKKIKSMALVDPDLKPLWQEIAGAS